MTALTLVHDVFISFVYCSPSPQSVSVLLASSASSLVSPLPSSGVCEVFSSEIFIYRYHFTSVYFSLKRNCVSTKKVALAPLCYRLLSLQFTLLLPSGVRPFRLAGGRGRRRPDFHCSSSGRELIQASGFGFVCSVFGYCIDVFFSPFLPLKCLRSAPVSLFLLRCLPTRIHCALAHAVPAQA